jgi:putative transposase
VPRQLRLEYGGAIYHLMNRGDRREEIVRDDGDRELFVATLGAAALKCGWQVHAWCLLGNHFQRAMRGVASRAMRGVVGRCEGSHLNIQQMKD